MIDDAIEKIVNAPYTPSNSLAVDALLVLKELAEAKRMDRVFKNRPDGLCSFVGIESPTVGAILGDSIKAKETEHGSNRRHGM